MVIYYTWWCCGALQVVLGTTAPLSVNCMVDTRRRCCPPYYLQSATILTRKKNNSNAYKCDYIVDNQNIGDPLIAFTDEALSPKAFTNCFHRKLSQIAFTKSFSPELRILLLNCTTQVSLLELPMLHEITNQY